MAMWCGRENALSLWHVKNQQYPAVPNGGLPSQREREANELMDSFTDEAFMVKQGRASGSEVFELR